MRRVFAIDVLRCPDCGGRMRILAAIQPPEAREAILGCLDDDREATAEAWRYEPDPDA